MEYSVKKKIHKNSRSLTRQAFVADKMLLFGSPANLALALWVWGEEEKMCNFCTNCAWFTEELFRVAHRVFYSTTVNIQGLGRESGSKDDKLFGVCIPN